MSAAKRCGTVNDSRRLYSGIALVAALALAGAACDNGGGGGGRSRGSGPIKVGFTIALTGPVGALGQAERNGYQLAIDEINAEGGIDGRRPIEPVFLDSKTDPQQDATNTRRLIDEGVVAILGGTDGGVTIDDIAIREEMLLIVPVGGLDVGQEEGPTKFHTMPTGEQNAAAVLCLATEVHEAESIGLLHSTDDFGKVGSTLLPDFGGELDVEVEVVAKEAVDVTDTDASSQVTKIRGESPDAFVLWAPGPIFGIAMSNAQDLGLDVPRIATLANSSQPTLDAAGPPANGVVLPGFLSPAEPAPHQQAFVDAYVDAYGEPPDAFAATAYDGMKLLGLALEEHASEGDIDSADLAQTLEDLPVYEGVIAPFDYTEEDHTSIALGDYKFLEARDGEFRPLDPQPSCEAIEEQLDFEVVGPNTPPRR